MFYMQELCERDPLEAIVSAQEVAEGQQVSIYFCICFCVRIALYWKPQDSSTISGVDKSIKLLPWYFAMH